MYIGVLTMYIYVDTYMPTLYYHNELKLKETDITKITLIQQELNYTC